MAIRVCGCMCGSTDNLIRGFLERNGFKDWATISIPKGKEKSKWMVSTLPQYPEMQMLNNFLDTASKWAVILGFDDEGNCRWADIAHGGEKSKIDAEFILREFA